MNPLQLPFRILLLTAFLQTATKGNEDVRAWPQQEGAKGTNKHSDPSDDPRFTELVPNVTVVVGRSATLKCSVENLKTYKIAWIKSDTQTLLSIEKTMITRNYRLRVTHSDDTTWFLHIDEAMMSDRGYYMCQINTVPPLVKQGYLEVVVPPNIVDEKLSGDVEVSEDSSARLKCMATGYPAPEIRFRREERWMSQRGSRGKATTKVLSEPSKIMSALRKDVEEARSRDSSLAEPKETLSKGTMLTIGYLTFDRVTRDDMGHYLCIANNSVPPSVSKRVVLNVRYREPEVVVDQQMLGVYQGDDVSINCSVTAYPRPVVFWQDSSGRMIISGGRYQVFEKQLKESPPVLLTTLTIRSIKLEDITSYTCNASIDNDEERSKSLVVELSEMLRTPTEIAKLDVPFHVPQQGKNLRQSRPKPNPRNDVAERYEKPTNFKPESFLPPSISQAGFDNTDESSANNQSKMRHHSLAFILIGQLIFTYANT